MQKNEGGGNKIQSAKYVDIASYLHCLKRSGSLRARDPLARTRGSKLAKQATTESSRKGAFLVRAWRDFRGINNKRGKTHAMAKNGPNQALFLNQSHVRRIEKAVL